MNKKSNYLIIALFFIVLAMGWQLYIQSKPTDKEKKEEELLEKYPQKEGFLVRQNYAETHSSGITIGAVMFYSGTGTKCSFTFPNGAQCEEQLKTGEGFSFYGRNGEEYELRVIQTKNEYDDKFIVFDIKRGNMLEHSYCEKEREQKIEEEKRLLQEQKETEESIERIRRQIGETK